MLPLDSNLSSVRLCFWIVSHWNHFRCAILKSCHRFSIWGIALKDHVRLTSFDTHHHTTSLRLRCVVCSFANLTMKPEASSHALHFGSGVTDTKLLPISSFVKIVGAGQLTHIVQTRLKNTCILRYQLIHFASIFSVICCNNNTF